MIMEQNNYPKKRGQKGFAVSFDIGEGNHIQAARERNAVDRTPIFLDYANFRCTYCGKKKPRKGSKMVSGFKKCADCCK